MVQGDHNFWNKIVETEILVDIELIGPTLATEEYRVIHNERVQDDL